MELHFDDYLDLLAHFLSKPAVVGAEEPFFAVLQRELETLGIGVRRYPGLLAAEGNRPDDLYLSAHIDRHGLVCTAPGEFQYASLVIRQQEKPLKKPIPEKAVDDITGRFIHREMRAYDPQNGDELGCGCVVDGAFEPELNRIVFRLEGLENLPPGTPAAYSRHLSAVNGRITGQIDNAITAAAIVHLYRLGYQGTAFFTAGEEAGLSWRYLLEWFKSRKTSTRKLIVLDTSPFPSPEKADAHEVVLRHRDHHHAFHHETVQFLEHACRRLNVGYVFKDEWVKAENIIREKDGLSPLDIGSTELGKLIGESEDRIQGPTLQIPTTGYHTPEETALTTSTLAFLKVLAHITMETNDGNSIHLSTS